MILGDDVSVSGSSDFAAATMDSSTSSSLSFGGEISSLVGACCPLSTASLDAFEMLEHSSVVGA